MHVIAHERHVPIEIQVRELLFEARLRINFVQEAAADGPTVAIRIVLVVEQRRFLLFLGVQSDVLVVVGAGEADVGAHLLPAVRGRACHACGAGAAAAGDRWGRATASGACVAALTMVTLAIDESATKRGLACRTPCALPRARFVDVVAATARRRTDALARGV